MRDLGLGQFGSGEIEVRGFGMGETGMRDLRWGNWDKGNGVRRGEEEIGMRGFRIGGNWDGGNWDKGNGMEGFGMGEMGWGDEKREFGMRGLG